MGEGIKAGIKHSEAAQEYYFVEGCYITELSNSADDPDVSIARARLEPGTFTRWHYLRDTSERYVILQGIGVIEVGDLPAQTVSAGDIVIIPPLARQRISNAGEDDLVFLAICAPRFTPQVYVDINE